METLFFHGFSMHLNLWTASQLQLANAGFKAVLQFSSPSSVNLSSVNNAWIPKEGRILSERPIFVFLLSKMLDPECLSSHQEALLMALPLQSSATVSRLLKRLELTPSHLPASISALPPVPDETLFSPEAFQINTRPLISYRSRPAASQLHK